MELKDRIDKNKLPQHIAIIMDGNGRWAKKHGRKRVFGHQSAIKSVRDAAEGSAEVGVKYLTLYAFSKENWGRPKMEVNALMKLLVSTIRKETDTLQKNEIKLDTIGDTSSLPASAQKELQQAMELTKDNQRMTLILALSYGARWEIVEATKQIAQKVKDGEMDIDKIDDDTIHNHLTTRHFPDPELMIRTSGEQRISNFLLWQLAYAELYYTDTLWPDFRKKDLYEAILAFQKRERRFGKTSEQIVV